MAGRFVQLTARDTFDHRAKVWVNLDHVVSMRRFDQEGVTVLLMDVLYTDEDYEGSDQPPLRNNFHRVAEMPEEIMALAEGGGGTPRGTV